jgi:hypothetical protein
VAATVAVSVGDKPGSRSARQGSPWDLDGYRVEMFSDSPV